MTPDIVRDPPRREHLTVACDEADLAAVIAALHDVAEALRALADHAPPDPHQLLRAEELAELLQLPVRTVRDRAAAGTSPAPAVRQALPIQRGRHPTGHRIDGTHPATASAPSGSVSGRGVGEGGHDGIRRARAWW